jgi:ArsR family metal-binding transcriptional regulator
MELLTTFPTREDAERARALLDTRGLPYHAIEPTAALRRVAVTALALTTEVYGELGGFKAHGVTESGWVEYRPATQELPQGPAAEFDEDVFGEARITTLSPCVAGETKIRIIAEISGNLAPAMPYLNAVNPQASYIPAGDTLTYMDGPRMVVLYPKRTAAAKPEEIVDAWLLLERIRRQVNEAWARRQEIEPCFETRKKPPALEIFKRLPGTNCGLCGELTCMAFAFRVWSAEAPMSRCSPLFEPEHAAMRAALMEIVAGLGLGPETA